jgi:hypothetical protein
VEIANIRILIGNNLKDKCTWGTQDNIKIGLKEIRDEMWKGLCGLSEVEFNGRLM